MEETKNMNTIVSEVENTENKLSDLKKMIEELQMDGSTYSKQNILKKYPSCKEILVYVYSPFINFYVTGDMIINNVDFLEGLIESQLKIEYTDIFLLLSHLNARKLTGRLAHITCLSFIETFSEYEEEIIKILNRDLKSGISIKTINKVYPDLIPEFNVPLASKYQEGMCDFDYEVWFLSRKLDGIRCLAFVDNYGRVSLYSRKGKEFFTLDRIKCSLENVPDLPVNIVLDGEICIVDEKGDEDFTSIMKEIRRKDHIIENAIFYIFDTYPTNEFFSGKEHFFKFEHKYTNLLNKFKGIKDVKVLEQIKISSKESLEEAMDTVPKKWEGLMLRNSESTKFKRSKGILKIKEFMDDEYTVIDTINGNKIIDGQIKLCCSSLVIEHKGYLVKVGSGLSDKQRISWYEDSSKIIGKKITVKYFNESKNKNGELSLRFPVLKNVWKSNKE